MSHKEGPWFKNPDWHMVWITVLLFVVGVYTACVFHRQFKEMQTQTSILNSQAQQAASDSVEAANRVEKQLAISATQAGAAREQAKAAQDQVSAIRQQMRVDQRAWVGVTAISTISAPKAGEPEVVIDTIIKLGHIDIPYTFIVKNTGKTPAKHLRIGSTTSFGVEPNRTPDTSGWLLYPGVLFPDQISERYPGEPISLDMKQWNEWVFGQKFVYVYIYIEYSDIFPGTKVHHTWMCSKFEQFGKQTFCHVGNDGD